MSCWKINDRRVRSLFFDRKKKNHRQSLRSEKMRRWSKKTLATYYCFVFSKRADREIWAGLKNVDFEPAGKSVCERASACVRERLVVDPRTFTLRPWPFVSRSAAKKRDANARSCHADGPPREVGGVPLSNKLVRVAIVPFIYAFKFMFRW